MNPGFYKLVEDQLLYAPNFVYGPFSQYTLLAENKEEYINNNLLPIDGWYWFDLEDEAYDFFGIAKPDDNAII